MTICLEVRHVTTYRYARPVGFGVHRVLFRPRAAHDIRVLDSRLEVGPTSRQVWIHDVFSNSVALVEPLAPARELRFDKQFSIAHHGTLNRELPVTAHAEFYPFDYPAGDRIDLSGFLEVQHPGDAAAVREWVAQFLPRGGRLRTHDLLARINAGIGDELAYAGRDAPGTQTPRQTLMLRSGTCRDFALLMIEAARQLGLAARFVTGYVYDAALDLPVTGARAQIDSRDAGGKRGSGATHAWLQVYLPGAGWVPFDPTNVLSGGTDLIRVACTRTPEQAAPVSGHWIGTPKDFLDMNVDVQVHRIPAPPATADPPLDANG